MSRRDFIKLLSSLPFSEWKFYRKFGINPIWENATHGIWFVGLQTFTEACAEQQQAIDDQNSGK